MLRAITKALSEFSKRRSGTDMSEISEALPPAIMF
jgi:hypothetical protein